MFQFTQGWHSSNASQVSRSVRRCVGLAIVTWLTWIANEPVHAQNFVPPALESSQIQVPGETVLPEPRLQFQRPSSPLPADQASPNNSSERLLERVEFSDTPIDQALQLFSTEANLNVVASKGAKDVKITVSIRNRLATVALKELARQNNLYVKHDATTGTYTLYREEDRDKNAWDPDTLRLFEQEVNEAFPDSYVRLSSVGKQLLVRGQAHDVVEASRIIRLIDAEAKSKKIKTYAEATRTTTEVTQAGGLLGGLSFMQTSEPELTIIDMLTVTGDQQVSLQVTVAEVDRNAARQIGLNFGINDGNALFQNLLGVKESVEVGQGLVKGGTLPTMLDNGQIQLAINALRQMSLAKTLAEPTLTALNGQQASFQAGGQFPVPVVSGLTDGGLQGVTFVPFGVSLKFTPYISDRDRIRLKVAAEVSNKGDSTNIGGSESVGGTKVAGLDQRKFDTIVELRDGQTLAVAGLITHSQNTQADRVPFFGDLPVVGRLAALDRISVREQELVILVTPQLVRALSPEERPTLPGTDIFEPGDIEFYLGARLEGNRNEDFRSSARTDLQRQQSFYNHRDVFIVGPHGYTECGPQPGVFR